MTTAAEIKVGAEVLGADDVHVGVVDSVVGDRIKLAKDGNDDLAGNESRRFIPMNLVAEVDGDKVWLFANGDVAMSFAEDEAGNAIE